MLTYNLDKSNAAPLYEQLYSSIRNDIISGVIDGDTRLPSKREFAEHLGVSKVTVENAYSLLISEGYVYSLPKKGYYAESGLQAPLRTYNDPTQTDGLSSESKTFRIDLSANNVPEKQFPFDTWIRMMRKVCLDYGKELLNPIPFNGTPYLRSVLCKYLFEERGMKVQPSQIFIGAGSEYLYYMIIKFFGNDMVYSAENPGYQKIREIYRQNGVTVKDIDIDTEGPSMQILRSINPNVFHFSPSHNFPSGSVTSPRRRNEILKWANEKDGRYIIEDDFDSELRFSGRPVSTLFSACSNENIIYLNTFSKTIAPSVRVAYMVLPAALAGKMNSCFKGNSCSVSSFDQYTLAAFIEGGYFERHISRTKKYYGRLRDELLCVFEKHRPALDAVLYEGEAGLHFSVSFNDKKRLSAVKKTFEQNNIGVSYTGDYYSGEFSEDENRIFINYSGLSAGDFDEVLTLMEGAK